MTFFSSSFSSLPCDFSAAWVDEVDQAEVSVAQNLAPISPVVG